MLVHEMRTPLVPIRNSLHVLELPQASPQDVEQARASIARQLDHLVRLVDELLDVYRLVHGKIELRLQPLELSVILARAVEMARPVLDASQHRLTVTVPEGIRLQGDPVRLVEVVVNLLTNAARYTGPGGQIELLAERAE